MSRLFTDPFEYFLANETRRPEQVRAETRQPFRSPEEEESALKKYLGAGLSGLGYVGQVLDKTFGGRAIRGALGGKPRELLSVIPGSDFLGITNQEQAVSGEDLARQFGVLEGEGEKGTFELRDLVGPAIEMGLDPATYMTFGASALTKGGQAAKKLGVLPKTTAGRIKGYQGADEIAKAMQVATPAEAAAKAQQFGVNINDLIGTPLGGLGGWRLPFGEPFSVFGTGPRAEAFAEGAGKLLDRAKYSWLGQRLSSLFSPPVQGTVGEDIQRAFRGSAPEAASREVATRGAYHDVLKPLIDVGMTDAGARGGPLRALIERPGAFVGPYSPDVLDALQESASRYRTLKDAELAAEQAAGIPKQRHQSVFDIGYATRQPTPLPNATGVRKGTKKGEALSTGLGTSIQREKIFDVSPRGTEFIESLLQDPRIAGQGREPTDVLGQVIPRLSADTPRKQRAVQQIEAAFRQGGPQSNKRVLRLIRENFLGTAPGTLAAARPFTKSELSRLRSVGPLTPQQAERLAQLEELQAQAKYLTRRLYQIRKETGLWKNPAEEVIPALNRAMQDRAAERIMMERLAKTEGFDPQRLESLRNLTGPLSQADEIELARLSHQAKYGPQLARYLGTLDPQRVGPEGVGLFGNDVLLDSLMASEAGGRALQRAGVAQDVLANRAVVTRAPDSGLVPVSRLLKEIGLTGKGVVQPGVEGKLAERTLLDALDASGVFTGGLKRDIKNVYVPQDVAEQLLQLKPRGELPASATDVLGPLAGLTTLTKTMMTAPRPAFHVRNWLSSMWENLAAGAPGGNVSGAQAMSAIRAGQAPAGLAQSIPDFARRGLTDEQAMAELGREMFAHRGAGRGMATTRETERLSGGAQGLAESIPGAVPQPSLGQSIVDWFPRSRAELNPLNVEGFGGRNVTTFAPARAGRQMGDLVDDLTRGGGYIDLRRQGYTPEAAAEAMRAAHFDYGRNLTQFERDWVRPLVPFYNFQKAIYPQIGRMLYETPGGLAGQGIRFGSALRQQEGFLPPYLGGGLAVPLGQEDETGTRRYLTKLDLPYEQPFELFSTGPDALSKTAMRVLGNLNPLLKAPLEIATNRQFYSGRELDDLYSRTGIPLADQIAMNSPLQPLLYAAGTALDPRKDWLVTLLNLGTGVRVSDVDMRQQRASAMNLLREMLASDPERIKKFESISVRPEQLANLTPEEIEMMRLLRTLESQASETKKAGR